MAIENLVFKGGGVLGIAYAGAISALDEENILEHVTGVAGTSAGSIVAALLSLRYTAGEIKDILAATNFKNFEDHWDPLRIPMHYGLYKGDFLLGWIKDIVKKKTGDENSTYQDLAKFGSRDLKVFAADLNTSHVKEFSKDTTPSVIVAESIRASMSIPFYFSAWKFPNDKPDNHVYVDGGTVYNYPINAFNDLNNTIGFFLFNTHYAVSDLNYHSLEHFVKSLFKTLMKSQDIDFHRNMLENQVTVKIDDFGISATDFNITPAMEDKLYKSGFEATKSFLQTRLKKED